MGSQFVDFLTAAAEDEWVATLQAQHALALAGQLHQQAVDPILRHRMFGAALADVQAFGIAAA